MNTAETPTTPASVQRAFGQLAGAVGISAVFIAASQSLAGVIEALFGS